MSRPAAAQPSSSGHIDTLIGAGMCVAGNIACTGTLRVQGEIAGNVACDGNAQGTLIVDAAGKVSGTVDAARVVVRGSIDGPLHSAASIDVQAGGTVAGDISFRELAIHPGGIVNGRLIPLGSGKPDHDHGKAPSALADAGPPGFENPPGAPAARRKRTVLAAGLAATGIAAVVWYALSARTPAEPSAATSPPRAEAPPANEPQPAAAPAIPAASTTPSAAAAPVPATPATNVAQAPAPASEAGDAAVVRGINPNRPSGVFLLVSSGAAVLYRKKQGDSGNGARIAVSPSERISVAVARDELIRVAESDGIEIFYQGQKVPPQLIDRGGWIRFVPR